MSRFPRSNEPRSREVDPALLDDDVSETIENTETETDDAPLEVADDSGSDASDPAADRLARLEQNQQVLSLLADPEIAAVVAARRAGKSVKVSLAEEAVEEQPDPTEELVRDLPEDDPTRGLLEKLDKLIDAKLGGQLKSLGERLKSVEEVGQKVAVKEVTDQVAAVRAKNKDFDRYKEEMLKISAKHPGLGVEDLYVLAKSRAGELRQVEAVTETEKPTSSPRVGVPKTQRPAVTSKGRQGFDQILRNALNNLELEARSSRR